jgi:hypothetical protein
MGQLQKGFHFIVCRKQRWWSLFQPASTWHVRTEVK